MPGCSQSRWSSQQRMKACLETTSMFCPREKVIGLSVANLNTCISNLPHYFKVFMYFIIIKVPTHPQLFYLTSVVFIHLVSLSPDLSLIHKAFSGVPTSQGVWRILLWVIRVPQISLPLPLLYTGVSSLSWIFGSMKICLAYQSSSLSVLIYTKLYKEKEKQFWQKITAKQESSLTTVGLSGTYLYLV